jgi:hypothetical protein
MGIRGGRTEQGQSRGQGGGNMISVLLALGCLSFKFRQRFPP